ncbi:hypothetical protein VL03_15390 [Rossellomorea marisflavi]|nr:hypothetical protein VL03_15390 [Rossellomorea marisflavi]
MYPFLLLFFWGKGMVVGRVRAFPLRWTAFRGEGVEPPRACGVSPLLLFRRSQPTSAARHSVQVMGVLEFLIGMYPFLPLFFGKGMVLWKGLAFPLRVAAFPLDKLKTIKHFSASIVKRKPNEDNH